MARYMGKLPIEEVKIRRNYRHTGLRGDESITTIEAGLTGWTIIYPDHSTLHGDEEGTSECNFDKAYKLMVKKES